MRVALLSLIESIPGEQAGLRGTLSVGGRAVLRHQLGLVLALGCGRVIVLAETLTGELVALQHAAEAAGARFHVVASGRALLPLVAPEDELVVLADGLLAQPDLALPLLGGKPVLLTLPVEEGMAAGFERLDLNSAGAGAMVLPGRLAAGLGDLPAEWNPASALVRIAAQAGIAQHPLPAATTADGRWCLLRSEAEAAGVEATWLRLHTGSADVRAPGTMLSVLAVRRIGPAMLHAGTRPAVVSTAAAATALLALGAAWFGWPTIGFALLAFAFLLHRGAAMLGEVERSALLARPVRTAVSQLPDWALDAALVLVCAWRAPDAAVAGDWRWFPGLVLVLLLRLLSGVLRPGVLTAWLNDRVAAAGLLALASALLPFDEAIRLSIIGLLLAGVVLGRRGEPLTNPELTSRS